MYRVFRYALFDISGVLCQKQISKAGAGNYIPGYMYDVNTCPCPWYLLLVQHYLNNIDKTYGGLPEASNKYVKFYNLIIDIYFDFSERISYAAHMSLVIPCSKNQVSKHFSEDRRLSEYTLCNNANECVGRTWPVWHLQLSVMSHRGPLLLTWFNLNPSMDK